MRHLAAGELFGEFLFRLELLLDLADALVDVGVGDGDGARLGFLFEQADVDHLIENPAIDLIALLDRHGLTRALFDLAHGRLEFGLADRLGPDPREHLRQRRRHGLHGRRRGRSPGSAGSARLTRLRGLARRLGRRAASLTGRCRRGSL